MHTTENLLPITKGTSFTALAELVGEEVADWAIKEMRIAGAPDVVGEVIIDHKSPPVFAIQNGETIRMAPEAFIGPHAECPPCSAQALVVASKLLTLAEMRPMTLTRDDVAQQIGDVVTCTHFQTEFTEATEAQAVAA